MAGLHLLDNIPDKKQRICAKATARVALANTANSNTTFRFKVSRIIVYIVG